MSQVEPLTMKSLFRPFPLPQTPRQWFYLTFLQGFGAGVSWTTSCDQPS